MTRRHEENLLIPTTPRTDGFSDAESPIASVVDLFCGVGGLTHGFVREGFAIAGGVDLDESCRFPYETNNGAEFHALGVKLIDSKSIESMFDPALPSVLVGCAPCQPFSSYNQKNADPKWQLVEKFGSLVADVLPDIVSMENVPRLEVFREGEVFDGFVGVLKDCGYHVWHEVVFCPDYGVPQRRKRLVLLASRLGKISLTAPTTSPEDYRTVRQTIGSAPRLKAGGRSRRDPLHRASRLSDVNMQRMLASKPGGTWRDWEDDLVTSCHTKTTGTNYVSVYGRMMWDEPAPTITTQFFGFGNGRFGHPSQHRAISLREGAMLQSFPADYEFVEPDGEISFKRLGRLIGNAVPVLLAQAIARSIASHLVDVRT